MNTEYDYWPISASESKAVRSSMPRIVCLATAVLVALIALVGLQNGLSTVVHQAQVGRNALTIIHSDGFGRALLAPACERKITGVVFEDLNRNACFDSGDDVLPGIVVTTSNGLVSVTDANGAYAFYTSVEPPLTVAIRVPPYFITTTSETAYVPPSPGTYERNFGLYPGLTGEKYSLDINGPPLFEGDELAYTIVVRNISSVPYDGVIITDEIPAATSYVVGSACVAPLGTVTVENRILTGYVDQLPPQDAITVTFRVSVDIGATGQEIDNQACVTSIIQRHCLYLPDEGGPRQVAAAPTLFLNLTTSDQVVRPTTEVVYMYTVSHTSVATLTNLVVTDSHLGPVSPTHFSLPPNGSMKVLTATAMLTENRTSSATVTGEVTGYSGTIKGNPATVTVHVIEGISLSQIHAEPPPLYHGNSTRLSYSVSNRDMEEGIVSGTVFIMDSLGRSLEEGRFDLNPGDVVPLASPAFDVPQDIAITVTATGLDDVQRTLLVSDQAALTLCPMDVYELVDDDSRESQVVIYPDMRPQLHDFSGDEDWMVFRIRHSGLSLYTLVARPLAPAGVPISMTFYPAGAPPIYAGNLDNPQSAVQLSTMLSCIGDLCQHDLQVQSSASGCGTDYEVWIEQTPWDQLQHIWLPAVLRNP